ncbi:MAG: hypothetical protein GY749_47795 [Desulfobacteraceae bacterium]|nr:hypothetical protein [Desulfobacteraceae bacterium]
MPEWNDISLTVGGNFYYQYEVVADKTGFVAYARGNTDLDEMEICSENLISTQAKVFRYSKTCGVSETPQVCCPVIPENLCLGVRKPLQDFLTLIWKISSFDLRKRGQNNTNCS